MANRVLTRKGQFLRQKDKQKTHHVSTQQRLQKPQEETGLINLAYTDWNICPH